MYSSFQLAVKYLKYYVTASNGKGHGLHSPFVFDFITLVLNDSRHFYAYNSVEELRSTLLSNQTKISIKDFGAGSAVNKSDKRTIAGIARAAAKPKKYAQLLFRMVDFYKANTVVELGTSLGLTTAYLAAANVTGHVYTFEGAPETAALAMQHFNKLSLDNISLIEGNFDDTLPEQLNKIGTVNLAFIDGNHRKEPTINYFNLLLQNAREDTILIFDDIHWSAEMEAAWHHIQKQETVTLTIDLFFIGLVFFRKQNKAVQHFTIRF